MQELQKHAVTLHTFPNFQSITARSHLIHIIIFIIPGNNTRLCHGDKHHDGNQAETTMIQEHSNSGSEKAKGVYTETHTDKQTQTHRYEQMHIENTHRKEKDRGSRTESELPEKEKHVSCGTCAYV